jgi:hypothetical protein
MPYLGITTSVKDIKQTDFLKLPYYYRSSQGPERNLLQNPPLWNLAQI